MITDAERYQWLKTHCIKDVRGDRDGPGYKHLEFKGRMFSSDGKFAVDHLGLDEAINDAIKRGKESFYV